jgi:mediator of DNA damage checkpoint protein 1
MTSKVSTDPSTLKNIIQASGGVLQRQTPTLRLIQNGKDRHILSCAEDIAIWRNMAENDIPIYTPEFVLMGVLTQKLDWEGYRVPGSRLS